MNKKQYINKLSIIFFLIIFVFFSCENEKEAEKEVLVSALQLKIDSLKASKFAKSFVEDIYASDSSSAYSKIQIAYEGDGQCVNQLLKLKAVFKEFDLYAKLNKTVFSGTDLKFENYTKEEEKSIIWLRLFSPPQEINYYRLTLSVVDNRIVILDYKSLLVEASCIDRMKQLTELLCEKQNISLKSINNGFLMADSAVKAFNSYNPEKASLYFSKIDLALRECEAIKTIQFNLEFHSSPENRLKALLERKKEYEKSSLLTWIWFCDFYINLENNDYVEAREALQNLKFVVGNDPILTYLEGTTYFEAYNYGKALLFYNEALSKEPTIPNFHFAKIICLIEIEEYVQAVESLLVMEDYFDVKNTNWDKEFMAYPEFLVSDEYSRWLERIEEG